LRRAEGPTQLTWMPVTREKPDSEQLHSDFPDCLLGSSHCKNTNLKRIQTNCKRIGSAVIRRGAHSKSYLVHCLGIPSPSLATRRLRSDTVQAMDFGDGRGFQLLTEMITLISSRDLCDIKNKLSFGTSSAFTSSFCLLLVLMIRRFAHSS
jgi:hypothetical protein